MGEADNEESVHMDELKTSRSNLKKKVAVTANRVRSAIERSSPEKIVIDSWGELETAYSDFQEMNSIYTAAINEEEDLVERYAVVNNLGLEEYEKAVYDIYSGARSAFHAYQLTMMKSEFAEICDKADVIMEKLVTEKDTYKLEILLERSKTLVNQISLLKSMKISYLGEQWTALNHDMTKRIQQLEDAEDNVQAKLKRLSLEGASSNQESNNFQLSPSVPSQFTQLHQNGSLPSDFSHNTFRSPQTVPSFVPRSNIPSSPADESPLPTSFPISSNQHHEVKVKKAELPHFSGKRKDWPEFKTLFPEMAGSTFSSKITLACELRRCLEKGSAIKLIENISITGPQAIDLMWQRLVDHYEDATASVNEVLKILQNLRPVRQEDYKYFTDFSNQVEACYTQLATINHLECITIRDVDNLCTLLPTSLKEGWYEKHLTLSPQNQLHPFQAFTQYLVDRRRAVSRLTEYQPTKKKEFSSHSVTQHNGKQTIMRNKSIESPNCAIHASANHTTENCQKFQQISREERRNALIEAKACFRCLKYHKRGSCRNYKDPCKKCGKNGHHTLLCYQSNERSSIHHSSSEDHHIAMEERKNSAELSVASHRTDRKNTGMYAIFNTPCATSKRNCTIFIDGGSDASYIKDSSAERLGAKKLDKYILEVTTTGGLETEYHTNEYELDLVTKSGKIVPVKLFGMKRITGRLSQFNPEILSKLFPGYDTSVLQRKSTDVDILLGTDYFGLHPKREICKAGDNLSIMEGELGVALQGSHPLLQDNVQLDSNMVKILRTVSQVYHSTCSHNLSSVYHPIFENPILQSDSLTLTLPFQSHSNKLQVNEIHQHILGEEIGTQSIPKCGSCKCGRCPMPGHTFSFQEEAELKLIREGLEYDSKNECWISKYPWKFDPSTLPDNYSATLCTLRSLEKKLQKDEVKANIYQGQILDMIERKVARKLSDEEIAEYKGPVYYISHLGVENPKSKSTPYRIVFNSSQLYRGVSLNNWLYKGPDAYMNNQLGVILRWRENLVAIVGDIKKMFNSVYLREEEQHCHRFLWTNLNYGKTPDIYVMTRVNMGDRPAGTISTEAMYLTAEMFQQSHPKAAVFLRSGSYVDDLLESVSDMLVAESLTNEAESLLNKGGFKIKYWLKSGESLEGDGITEVLGLSWIPQSDCIIFCPGLNFSPKKKGVHTLPDLTAAEVPSHIPANLTKRMVLSQVMKIYDPYGVICPFTLIGKILLRETWEIKVGWDDPLPDVLKNRWVLFLCSIYDLRKLRYPRSIKPQDAVGDPMLILLSDASDKAYGVVAYARWNCEDGSFKSRFIVAKNRIAPITKRSTPQLELNAALLSKRIREVIETEMRYKFTKVLHLIDSETVLAMLHKVSTRFKLYEGVRIGEIQAATNGDISSWAWIPGTINISDWLTRGKDPHEINSDSEWYLGPSFLSEPESSWNLKFTPTSGAPLPGEKKVVNINQIESKYGFVDYTRFGKYSKLLNTVSRILNAFKKKSFYAIAECPTPTLLVESEKILVMDVQKSIKQECERNLNGKIGGRYQSLKPLLQDGVYVVGTRLVSNPLVPENNPQMLVPTKHMFTTLVMMQSHVLANHGGRDSTLARFRQKFWTPNASKVAKSIVQSCQLCKIRIPKLLSQKMGMLPSERSKPAPPFTYTMLDYFGPFEVRGEVQKRISGKVWGIIFTCMISRAVHIEAVYDYSTSSFLLALSKFANIRGYPNKIYSDNDPKLVCADNQLDQQWKLMWEQDSQKILEKSALKGLEWIFSSPDAPWMNGAVESLIKSVKKAIKFSMNNQRLSPFEFSCLLYEVANILNERPIGTLTSTDSELSVLTPNSLLLGRSLAKNPLGWEPQNNASLLQRFHLIQQISSIFWKQWISTCAPQLITDVKWHTSHRDLEVGDVVMVVDSDSIKSEYRLAIVKEVFRGKDGVVRKAMVSYKHYKVGDSPVRYTGSTEQCCVRPIQRLALIVPAV